MLELDHMRFTQGAFTLSADWSLPPGARVAVIGPSGAGKSTLLMGMAGFLPGCTGALRWQGATLEGQEPGARPFAVLFQDSNLFAHMSIAQNVGLGLRPSLRLSREQSARVEAALERVGLAGMGARKPAELSGGQQSRAALARVLLQSKPWLMLDEPFAALGPALKAEMLDLVAEICAQTGSGLLMVSHDPEDARRICPQAVLVAEGLAHPPQDTAALLQDPPQVLRDYL